MEPLRNPGRFNCLVDAFRQYRWHGEPWDATKAELDGLRRRLRAAVKSDDVDRVVGVCEEILSWGGVAAHNVRYLRQRTPVLLNELRHVRALLAGDSMPSKHALRIDPDDPATECRMNAGFVKIYSLFYNYCVIYDGRVGAALGLLVRQFCEATKRATVPSNLRFAFGSPKESPNTRNRKLRNPSCGTLQFPQLRSDSWFHIVQVMRTN